MNKAFEPEEPTRRPDACPYCQSKAIGTFAKKITRSTYWHCRGCGRGWNERELKSAER
jgi:ribosomal protein L37AE/L43A